MRGLAKLLLKDSKISSIGKTFDTLQLTPSLQLLRRVDAVWRQVGEVPEGATQDTMVPVVAVIWELQTLEAGLEHDGEVSLDLVPARINLKSM